MCREVWLTKDFSLLCPSTARRHQTVPSSAASPSASLSSSKTSADGTWQGKCLSPSHGEPLRGRRRAHNPTARVGRLQSYTWTSAVGHLLRSTLWNLLMLTAKVYTEIPLLCVWQFFHWLIIHINVVVGYYLSGCTGSVTICLIITQNEWYVSKISWNQTHMLS